MFGKGQKYKFTDKKHSKGGVISSLLLLVSFVMLMTSIYLSYKSAGEGGYIVGLLAMVSLIFALAGFAFGIRSFKEENVFYSFSWFGIIGNTVLWLFLVGLLLVGL